MQIITAFCGDIQLTQEGYTVAIAKGMPLLNMNATSIPNVCIYKDYFGIYQLYHDNHDSRVNPILIELLPEYHHPDCEFKIVNIPNNIDWYIDESDDGIETIHQVHKQWN
jgi:hypothetical protein